MMRIGEDEVDDEDNKRISRMRRIGEDDIDDEEDRGR